MIKVYALVLGPYLISLITYIYPNIVIYDGGLLCPGGAIK